jgi:CDP-diacylglycerol--glycerol-3-phosphate 3-phosphatidyltransferase
MTAANALTLSRMVLAPLLLVLFYVGTGAAHWTALAVLVIAGVTDLLDGHLARRNGQTSAFGKVVDPLSDSFIFLSLFGGFVLAGWMPAWVFAIFLLRESFMHGFLRPFFLQRGVALAAKWAGKLKTALQCAVGVAVLLAIAWTHGMPLRAGSLKAGVMTAAWWALLVAALVSAASLRAYVVELWSRRTGEETAAAVDEEADAPPTQAASDVSRTV